MDLGTDLPTVIKQRLEQARTAKAILTARGGFTATMQGLK